MSHREVVEDSYTAQRLLRLWRWYDSWVLPVVLWVGGLFGSMAYFILIVSEIQSDGFSAKVTWTTLPIATVSTLSALVSYWLLGHWRKTLWSRLLIAAESAVPNATRMVVLRGMVTLVLDPPGRVTGRTKHIAPNVAAYWVNDNCEEGYVVVYDVGRFMLRCGGDEVQVEGAGGAVLVAEPPGWRETMSHIVAYEFETERQVATVGSEVLVVGYLTGSANAGGYRSGSAVLRAHGRDRVLVAILHGAEPVADLPVPEGPIWRYGPR